MVPCECVPQIDVRELKRKLGLAPGSGGHFEVVGIGRRRIEVREATVLVHDYGRIEFLDLRRTPQHLGGWRVDFLCPTCDRGAAKLYRFGGRYACRRCQGLGYLTQTVGRLERLGVRVRRIEAQLGPDGSRPHGMRWKRYLRLLERSAGAMRRQTADVSAALKRMLDESDARREREDGAANAVP